MKTITQPAVLVARISFLEADGNSGIEWERFASDSEAGRAELNRLMTAQRATLMPLERWTEMGGALCASTDHTNGPSNYDAYIERVTLVA